jgi:hypothetical protein
MFCLFSGTEADKHGQLESQIKSSDQSSSGMSSLANSIFGNVIPIPLAYYSDVIAVYDSFVAKGSQLELNLKNETVIKMRKTVEGARKAVQANRIEEESEGKLMSDVFDEVRDEVLNMLYRNTFVRFVRYKKSHVKNAQTASAV